MMEKYGEGLRKETVILVSKTNLLTPEVMEKLWMIQDAVNNITFKGEFRDEMRLVDLCIKWVDNHLKSSIIQINTFDFLTEFHR